jgi:hypothetical protein
MTEVDQQTPEVSLENVSSSVDFIIDKFFATKQYSKVHEMLSTTWDSYQSLNAAIKLMEQYGVVISPQEEEQLLKLDEAAVIDSLVARMPSQTKEQFEQFFVQLQLIVSTAARMRGALDQGEPKAIEAALNDADKHGITPYILKMSIVQAGAEVTSLSSQHNSWCKDNELKLSRFLRGQDDAMAVQKALGEAQAQLFKYSGSHKDKAKKALMAVCGKNDKALVASSFNEWRGVKEKMKKENEIRSEYAERIEAAQKRLFDYKQSQKGNAKGVLLRQAAAGDGALIGDVFGYLCKELKQRKDDEEAAKKLAEIEAKLAAQSGKNKDNAKAVLMRNLASGDNQLMDVCLECWKKWLEEYKKNKESEDAVKDAEAKVAAFMKQKSEGAKGIIDRMNSATDSGLVEHVISTWVQYYKDIKKAEEMEALINGNAAKFASFGARNKQGAMSAGEKATAIKEYGLINHAMLLWMEVTKVERMLRYYTSRIDGKKQQLQGLQGMFRNFANQLESGLKEGTPRDFGALKNKKSGGGLSKSDNTVSLPNIHQKQSGSRNGSHRS